jgi:CBS domain-containing protein
MSVEAILKAKGNQVYTVRPENSIGETAILLAEKSVGVAVVCDSRGRVVGMASEGDLVSGMAKYGKGALDLPVRNVMSSPAITCGLADSAKTILETMHDRRVRHVPVIENEELIGLVSLGDVVQFRLREAQLEVGVLRDFANAH